MSSRNLSGIELLNLLEKDQGKRINGQELRFSHLSKIYWPKEKYTKREMLNYYHRVATFQHPFNGRS